MVWERKATRGEFFDAAAVRSSARVALLGETVAKALFGTEDPIGGEIMIDTIPFHVVGILERFGSDVHGMDRDNEVVVPISTMMRRVMNVDTISSAKVILKDVTQSEAMAAEIRRVLHARHAIAAGQPDDFTIVTPLEVQGMVAWAQRILDLYLPLVAGIALLVGGIVAASLMLVSVNERVGEIGLRRAVGARPEDIGLQFLVETTVTTLVGGLGGIALGYLGAHAASVHLHLGDILSWRAVLIGVTASILTGLLAGVAPARRAARLQPADALR
jgi:putative ABC transport system permease protein